MPSVFFSGESAAIFSTDSRRRRTVVRSRCSAATVRNELSVASTDHTDRFTSSASSTESGTSSNAAPSLLFENSFFMVDLFLLGKEKAETDTHKTKQNKTREG